MLKINGRQRMVFCGIRVARSLAFCVVFCRSLFVLLSFFFLLPVPLRFTASDYTLVSSNFSHMTLQSVDLKRDRYQGQIQDFKSGGGGGRN